VLSAANVNLAALARLTSRERRLISAYRGEGGAMEAEPDKVGALKDAARALERAGIPYALIGGVAVGIHAGAPRATVDVDFAVHRSAGPERVVAVLEEAGFRKVGVFPHSANFRHSSGEPVQVFFDPGFDEMIDRAEVFDADGVVVKIVRKDDLITMKERAASDPERRKSKRLRDQADVEVLRGDAADPDEGW
jgi:predicted nucleotidyltransferase